MGSRVGHTIRTYHIGIELILISTLESTFLVSVEISESEYLHTVPFKPFSIGIPVLESFDVNEAKTV